MIQLPFSAFLVALYFFPATLPVDAQSPAKTVSYVVRSGDILTCHLGKDCTEEIIDGRSFYVMQTDRLIVKVAVQPSPRYSHVSVAVENRAGFDIRFAPEDFRIEMTEPKFKRLSYIKPARLKLPKVKAPKTEAPPARTMFASSFMGASHQDKVATVRPNFLNSSTLAPAESASGEVFFERARNTAPMSLLLPIAGSIFEFPYTPSK